ncbi:ATP-binding protein [Falsirhodobacter halotolerans]|uniref:ATP-binding protein n=1 Tax=Falsirhodobacter halotolerans TaxID=1146892 RepID=UPI001FD2B15D|nr:ATP-binding protein [Falsirhodobacter halotolerans]MCJ8141125.1 ATP-binding protein [Falsirhodobacter halotolerans]
MYHRPISDRIDEALSDTRVVLISGPRQSGKTTLARQIAGAGRPYFTLDDATTLEAAHADPVGFLRGLDRVVIDEVQRAPALLLAIKTEVDRDRAPGRFLLTGSANLMTLPRVADSLAGRMETVPLLPLSQAEIAGRRSTFVDDLLAGRRPIAGPAVLGPDLVAAVLAGGYPEAVARPRWSRRQDWYLAYVDAIVQRDIHDIAEIEKAAILPRLVRMMAEHSGQLTNYSALGAQVGLNHVTTQKYSRLFESLFLVETVPPWFSNRLKRLVKSPKLHFLDSGLLAALRDMSPDRVARDRQAFGALLETFVHSELRKIAAWGEARPVFSHFRDKDGTEVDVVLETRDGAVAGVEVKASATVASADFRGLRKMSDALGDRFVQGVVLYDGDQVVPFAENLFAVPVSALWGAA